MAQRPDRDRNQGDRDRAQRRQDGTEGCRRGDPQLGERPHQQRRPGGAGPRAVAVGAGVLGERPQQGRQVGVGRAQVRQVPVAGRGRADREHVGRARAGVARRQRLQVGVARRQRHGPAQRGHVAGDEKRDPAQPGVDAAPGREDDHGRHRRGEQGCRGDVGASVRGERQSAECGRQRVPSLAGGGTRQRGQAQTAGDRGDPQRDFRGLGGIGAGGRPVPHAFPDTRPSAFTHPAARRRGGDRNVGHLQRDPGTRAGCGAGRT